MNKTIEGFQINNNVGFGSEALNAQGRRIAQQRGFSTDNPTTASDPGSTAALQSTCKHLDSNNNCEARVDGFRRPAGTTNPRLEYWQLGDGTNIAGTQAEGNTSTQLNYLNNERQYLDDNTIDKFGVFKKSYFTFIKNQYNYLRVILDDKIANKKTDDRISDYNANQTDIRKYQINQLEAAKDNDMIVLLTILMIVLIICMVPVILGYQGIIEKDIVIMAAGGIFSLFFLYLLKYTFIDSALRSDKYAYKYDFKKPTDADLSESKDYDKIINKGGSGRGGRCEGDRDPMQVTDFDLDDEQGGIDRAQMGSDVEDSIGSENYASDRLCQRRTIY